MANISGVMSSDISRRNPQDEYELIQRIGSGTYGDVYKVNKFLYSFSGIEITILMNEAKLKIMFQLILYDALLVIDVNCFEFLYNCVSKFTNICL